ncbi:MAG: alpha-amylase family glycosyl hydrolase [Candidatus Zhuqueibacterota bacterium]
MVWSQQSVTFSLKPAPATQSVYIAGSFNDWSKKANPMTDADGDGVLEATLFLDPGRYEYRFLVDDLIWIKDPLNPDWGGERSNSILRVMSNKQPRLTNLQPAIGSGVTTGQPFISANYHDGIIPNGIDMANTKVLVNGREVQCAFNEKMSRIEAFRQTLEDGEYRVEIRARDLAGNEARPIEGYFIVNQQNAAPRVDAGYTIIRAINSDVYLNSGVYFDPDKDRMSRYQWKLISKPAESNAKLRDSDTPFPHFTPDAVGRYLFTLHVSDGKAVSDPDSVDVYAFIERDYPVQFRLSDSLFSGTYEASIESVSVVGEFNGWNPGVNPMTNFNRDDEWSAWIDLDPGEYEYKFVVNGKHWIPDPANPARIADGWNGFNSIMSARLNLAPVVEVNAVFGPGKIILDGSTSHSQTGKNLTFSWYQDINNPQRYEMAQTDKIELTTPKKVGTYYFYLVVVDQFGNSARKTAVLNVDKGRVDIRDFSDSPDWPRDAIVYEVFVRNFTPGGDFSGLMQKLPYLKALGINCIWLMPVMEGPTSHGYGPSDFFTSEIDYGTLNEFRTLVQQAKAAGIRVIFDFVANHSSDQHPYFLSAFQNPNSPYRDWYCWQDHQQTGGYYSYQFHNDWDTLPNLNYENPNVRRYILDVAEFWTKTGIDGFRCDVAWAVPHDFWKLFRRTIKNINPDLVLLNEVLPRSPAFHKDEFDMSYDTDFYGNLLDVLNKRKPLSAIDFGLQKTKKNYSAAAQDFRYIENHDMDRFISQFGLVKTKLAATLLLTIPGTPLIYYGQEIGLREKTPLMDWSRQDDPLLDYYRKLILLRRNQLSLRRGDMVKVATNADDQVYAYLRKNQGESLLVVLNFGDELDACQLLLPDGAVQPKKQLRVEDAITLEKYNINFVQSLQIQMALKKEMAYVFRILN